MIAEFTQPHSPEAERSVLGACILDKEALAISLEMLTAEDFSESRHSNLFQVMIDMYSSDKPIDYLTIADELKAKNIFDRLGGQTFINTLVADVMTTANVAYHAKIVRDYAIRRKIISAGQAIINSASTLDKEIPAVLNEAEKLLSDASQNKDRTDYLPARELIGPVFANIVEATKRHGSKLTGYPTGFIDLDAITGGLQPGSLNIIAARPSMGKTSFAMNIAQFGGGESNAPVLVFSIEMPSEHLVQRMIAAEAGIDLSKLMRGMISTDEFHVIRNACDVLAKREIYINDSTSLSAMDFRGRCRRFKMKHPDLALVVVDYLQLMSYAEKRNESRNQEVSDISRILKSTARELNCPVIALSQLSREAEKRTDKKPQLADLRDSGAIEQDADLVMMLYREDYYSDNENNNLTDSKADIRIAKNRNGTTGVMTLTFKRELTRFFNHGEE